MDNNKLKDYVQNKLLLDIWVEEKGVNVNVEDGIVTLSGTVPSYFGKIHAADVVKKIWGVKGVVNELRVNLSTHLKRNDQAIAQAAVTALEWDVAIPTDTIKVVVENAIVTLSGEVAFDSQRTRAYNDVRSLYGVENVINAITLKLTPQINVQDVEKQIERDFQRNAALHAHKIKVKIEGKRVCLSGSVSSWFEYKEANDAAFAVPGVQEVQNDLEMV